MQNFYSLLLKVKTMKSQNINTHPNVLISIEKEIVKLSLTLFLSLSISLYLNLTLSLRDRDRADTIITLPPHHHHHRKLFKDLRVDLYSSVIHHWNRQLKPY